MSTAEPPASPPDTDPPAHQDADLMDHYQASAVPSNSDQHTDFCPSNGLEKPVDHVKKANSSKGDPAQHQPSLEFEALNKACGDPSHPVADGDSKCEAEKSSLIGNDVAISCMSNGQSSATSVYDLEERPLRIQR